MRRDAVASVKPSPPLEVQWADEVLQLHCARAVYWPRRATLIVADLHLGKTDTFRDAGIPVPSGTTRSDLARLSSLLAQTQAKRLVLLGDLLHARQGRTPSIDAQWLAFREQYPAIQVVLVRGNHDRHAGDPPAPWRIDSCSEPCPDAPFAFCHHPPTQSPAAFTMAGHLHPCVRINDFATATLRLPCFHIAGRVMVLPAFGGFTGMHPIRPRPNDRIYIAGPDAVIAYTPCALDR